MGLLAPRYYLDFNCIADRCRHSCCIGWEIDIDGDTARTYAALTAPYAESIRESIEEGETPHFCLDDHERCPHLNDKGLCRIILTLGEEYLCDICREHPRFYHETPHGDEVGVGMACEEACRLILSSDDYATFVTVEPTADADELTGFDATEHRARIYAVLSDRTLPYAARLQMIADTYGVSPRAYSDEVWRERLAGLEYLDEMHRSTFACYSSCEDTPCEWETMLERALAYFVFRHCSAASDEQELLSRLGFCLLCERLLNSLICAATVKDAADVCELARIVSEEIEYSEDNTAALREMF